MNKIERLTNEILLLQERKRGSEELADLLEVSKRTIIRDMQALTLMGVPIIARDGVSGGYSLPKQYTIQPLQLTWKEALLLMLALGSIARMSDSPFAPERATLLAKIEAIFPEKHRERVEGLLDKVGFEVPERPQKSPLLEELLAAVEEGQWLRIQYRTGDRGFEVTVKPERIYADRGYWYVSARRDGMSRIYRVDRIVGAARTEPPPESEVEQLPYNHPSHPLLRVSLSAVGVQRVQQDPHIGPHLAGDGPQHLEFHCPESELDWYARYFGGMAGDAVVESPPELIDKICARADEIRDIYMKR